MPILSGQIRGLNGDECEYGCEGHDDDGCPNKAASKMAGEVDSFGVEWIYLCDDCMKTAKEEIANDDSEDACDRCHKTAKLRPYRDLDEGNNGPQYLICQPCYNKAMTWHAEDLSNDDDDDYYDEDESGLEDHYPWGESDEG